MNKIVKLIIFSKDRPLQLKATLESFFENCKDSELVDVKALVKAEGEYLDAYNTLLSEFKDKVEFIYEQNFYTDMSKLVMFGKRDFIMFLVDDIIFKSEFKISDCTDFLRTNDSCFTFSLRLGKGLDYCYSISQKQREPKFERHPNSILTFTHDGCDGDYGYPISLDGNIFRTNEFNYLTYVKDSRGFHSPNILESVLSLKIPYLKDKTTACFETSKLFNIPANRVQDEIKNRNEGLNPKDLLKIWQEGYKIDVSKYKNIKNNSCHFPVELEYVKQ